MSTDTIPRTYTVRVMLDHSPEDPREWENMGTMAGRTGRSDWTHVGHGGRTWTAEDTLAHIIRECGGDAEDDMDGVDLERLADSLAVVLPVYKFDHSGVAYSCRPFGCPWDSGQVGYIFAPLAKVAKEYGDTSPATLEKVRGILRAEVETFSQWASGEVFGYIVEDAEGEEVGSCWGFYGSDHEASGLLPAARDLIPDGAAVEVVEKF